MKLTDMYIFKLCRISMGIYTFFKIIAAMKSLTLPLLHTAAVSLYVVRMPEISSLSQVQVHSPAAPATASRFRRSVFRMRSSCTPETGSPSVPTLSLLLQSLAATTLLSAFLSLIYFDSTYNQGHASFLRLASFT